jgi:hypothetical protein
VLPANSILHVEQRKDQARRQRHWSDPLPRIVFCINSTALMHDRHAHVSHAAGAASHHPSASLHQNVSRDPLALHPFESRESPAERPCHADSAQLAQALH